MNARNLAAALFSVVLLGACMTAPSQSESKAAEILQLINDGATELLVDQSHVPFFFDGELLVRAADVELTWASLRASGFEVSADFAIEPAMSADYLRIADTFDMQTFFSPDHFLPDDAGWLMVNSSAGDLLILLGDRSGGLPLIYGIARVR